MSESTISSPPTDPKEVGPRPLDYGTPRKPGPAAERVISFFKTLAWVAPLTVLIWIYAEREQSATQSNISFPIEIRTPDGSRIVTLKEPADQNVTAQLTGPRTVLEQFIRDLQSGGSGHPALQIVLGSNLDKGEYPYDAAKMISETPLFTRQGINIKDVLPRTLRVEIDDYESRLLPVRASQDNASLQEFVFVPATVEVRAPSHLFKKLEADPSKLVVIADTSKLASLTEPKRYDVAGLPVQAAFKGDHVTVTPSTVGAQFIIARPDAETTLGSVPVWSFAPPPVNHKYEVDYKTKTVNNVVIKGPPKEIAAIKSGDFSVVAALDITPDDAATPKAPHHTKLRFNLPPGVTVVSSDPDAVDFTLIERTSE